MRDIQLVPEKPGHITYLQTSRDRPGSSIVSLDLEDGFRQTKIDLTLKALGKEVQQQSQGAWAALHKQIQQAISKETEKPSESTNPGHWLTHLQTNLAPTSAIFYLIGTEHYLHRILVTREDLTATSLPMAPNQKHILRALATNVHWNLPPKKYHKIASDMIFKDLLTQVGDKTHLHLVVEGWWLNIPFAALHIAPEKPLIEGFELSFSRRLSKNPQAMSSKRHSQEKQPRILAAAPSKDLPYAKLEVESLDKAVRLYDSTTLAQEIRAGTYDIVHLTGHSDLNTKISPETGMWFTTDSERIDYLNLGDWTQATSLPSLVILNSCHSGEFSKKSQNASLAQALRAIGVQSVIANTNGVSDFDAAILMKHFHRYLPTDGARKALQKAMLRLRQLEPSELAWAQTKIFQGLIPSKIMRDE